MTTSRLTTVIALAAGITAGFTGGLPAQDVPTLPLTLRARAMVPSIATADPARSSFGGGAAPAGGSEFDAVQITITIDRWTTDQETATLRGALESGGQDALLSAMEASTVGSIHVEDGLRLPVWVAITWQTDEGRLLRLVTRDGLLPVARAGAPPRTDYAIDFVDLALPLTGHGKGTVVEATRVEFDRSGRAAAAATRWGTGPQRISNVEIAPARKSSD